MDAAAIAEAVKDLSNRINSLSGEIEALKKGGGSELFKSDIEALKAEIKELREKKDKLKDRTEDPPADPKLKAPEEDPESCAGGYW